MIETGISKISTVLGLFAGIMLIGISIVTLIEVAGRTFFSSPNALFFELSELGTAMVAFLAVVYAAETKRHVTIDLLPQHLVGIRHRLDIASGYISAVLILLFALAAGSLFIHDVVEGVRIGYSGGLPRWPGTLTLFFSTLLLCTQELLSALQTQSQAATANEEIAEVY